ncbi:hypothetical protein BC827DRAFT_442081 [Russula dissimulans]|nr:hypothetical protein BC827DRAFT_442081 [Russula dissimulans]
MGHVMSPQLDEPLLAPGRGWLWASDDTVHEVRIETVLQEGSGAFMLYYERVRNEDRPPIRFPCPKAVVVGNVGGGSSIIEEKIQTHRLQGGEWEGAVLGTVTVLGLHVTCPFLTFTDFSAQIRDWL